MSYSSIRDRFLAEIYRLTLPLLLLIGFGLSGVVFYFVVLVICCRWFCFVQGKRGACVGVFQLVVAGKAHSEDLQSALAMVRNTSNPQVEYMHRIMKKWCSENSVKI